MTAADRRNAWYGDERLGIVEYLRGHEQELIDSAAHMFYALENMFGREAVSLHLLKLLPKVPQDAENWETVLLGRSVSPRGDGWKAAELLDGAGLYGLFGVTPAEIPFSGRGAWVAALPLQLSELRKYLGADAAGRVERVVSLALSRHAMEFQISYSETGAEAPAVVDLHSLAIFGGLCEGRIRNLLSSGDGGLEKAGKHVTATSAAAWLKGRKEFFSSIWKQPDTSVPPPSSPDFSGEVVFVPVAADGSLFHPGLVRGGKFMIGAKGEEVQHASFDDALAALHRMATPRWRRPNDAGNWGIVSGRDWKRVERRQLLSTPSA
jgi:hypothetical protein